VWRACRTLEKIVSYPQAGLQVNGGEVKQRVAAWF
jgi:hypothetical protein